MASQLVMGMDLDPASTDDFRHVVAQTLAPDGYVVGGIQMTESPPEGVDAGEQADDDGGVRGAAPGVDLREDGQRLVQPPRLARALRGDGLDVVQPQPRCVLAATATQQLRTPVPLRRERCAFAAASSSWASRADTAPRALEPLVRAAALPLATPELSPLRWRRR